MARDFIFIDGVNADKAAQTSKRRHVMMGKNAGKTIIRRPRAKAGALTKTTIPKSLDDPLPGIQLPMQVTTEAAAIIRDFFDTTYKKTFPVRLGINVAPAKDQWVRVLFSDVKTYDVSLALMQSSNAIVSGSDNQSPRVLYFRSRALGQVKRQLEGKDALSDSSIAMVISLIHLEQVQQHVSVARVHIEGLKRMVDLRGGIDALSHNPALVLKIHQTDVIFSIQHGCKPSFYRDRLQEIKKHLISQGVEVKRSSDIDSVQKLLYRLDPTLLGLLLDIMGLCSVFNRYAVDNPLNIEHFVEVMLAISYRLLGYRTIMETMKISDFQSAVHIGLITLTMSIFLQFYSQRVMKYLLLNPCLEKALNNGLEEKDDELALWLLVVGGVWSGTDVDGQWIYPRLRDLSHKMSLDSWVDALKILRKYPWVDDLHTDLGNRVWAEMQRRKSLVIELPLRE